MPRDPRVNINFLLAPSGRDGLDDLAAATKSTRSDVLRAALKVAFRHKTEIIDVLKGRL